MQLFNFVSVKLALCLIIGILLGFYSEPSMFWVGFLLISAFMLLLIRFKVSTKSKIPFFELLTGLTTILLGVFLISLTNPKNISNHYSKHDMAGAKLWHLKIKEVLKPTAYSHKYVVAAKTLEGKAVSGSILVNIQKDSSLALFKVDDELAVFSNVEAISKRLNPYQFDYKDYLKKQGIYHQLRIDSTSFFIKEQASKTLVGIAANFRATLINKLKKEAFGKEELGVIQALLLGQRNDISEAVYTDYKNSGAVHILAVSGLHIGVLLLLLQFLLQPLTLLPQGGKIKLIAILILLWAFAFVAGLSPSVVRAVTMFSFLTYALYLNRPSNTFNILALSLFFILLVQPLFLFQVGFQMSYAAVFAIVWIYPKLQRFWYPKNWPIRKIWQLLSVSFAAQLGVLPLSLFYFHQFPALFFVSNLVIVPFLGLILGLGILVLLLTNFNILPDFLVTLYNQVIKTMNTIIGWIAQQEGFLLQNIPFDRVQLILGFCIAITLIWALTKTEFKNLALLFLCLIGFQIWILYKTYETSQTETVLITHQTANTILLHQKGKVLRVLGIADDFSERMITDYAVAERIDAIEKSKLQNSYTIGNQSFYILDSLAVYPSEKNPDYLLLTQSPKINLARFLDSIQPTQIIADGSNYKSYVKRWQTTCAKKEIPFHYTGEKGAFYLERE